MMQIWHFDVVLLDLFCGFGTMMTAEFFASELSHGEVDFYGYKLDLSWKRVSRHYSRF